MKNFADYIKKCSEEICYPDKLFLGFAFDSDGRSFVRLYYWGLSEYYIEPCSPAEVEPDKFIDSGIFAILENGYDRDFLAMYICANRYDSFIDLQELEDFDLRYAAYLLFGMQNGDDRGWHTVEIVKNALRILIERVAETEEEALEAYKL